jgi:hypothetical protein
MNILVYLSFISQGFCSRTCSVAEHAMSSLYDNLRIPLSWKWRRVALVRTNVSEEPIDTIIRVTRIGELQTKLRISSKRSMLRFLSPWWWGRYVPPKRGFLTIVTQCHIPEDGVLSRRRENLIPYIRYLFSKKRFIFFLSLLYILRRGPISQSFHFLYNKYEHLNADF